MVRSTTPAVAPAPWQTRSYSATMSRRACTTTNSCPSAERSPGANETCESSTRNGAVLRIWNLTSSSRSAARDGTSLNRTSETFAAASGMASATRAGRWRRRSKAARMAAMTSSGLTTFDEVSEGTMAPSGSGSTAQASSVTPAPRPETATAVTRSAAISIATGGGGVRRIEGILIRRRSPC